MLGITSAQLQCHPGYGYAYRAHESSSEPVKVVQLHCEPVSQAGLKPSRASGLLCSWRLRQSVDIGGHREPFSIRSQCCDCSLSPHPLLLQLLPCYFFLISPCQVLRPHPPSPSKTTEEPSWSRQPPCPPSRAAQHGSQQHMLSWVEASKDALPTAGPSRFLLPPQGSFIITINGRKQNGHQELQYGLDLSKFSWDRDTARHCRPKQILLAREQTVAGPGEAGIPGSTLEPLPRSPSPTAPLAAASKPMSTLAVNSVCRFKSQTLPQEIKR